jgi:succinoglycan biosynthesis protein ExoM
LLVSVCIATYKRPKLLSKLLQSLESQALPGDVEMEIIVVDNDTETSAKIIASQFHMVKYFVQNVKNISLTRNMAVKEAKGEYIAFIDDDEYTNEFWLALLIETIQKYKADGVFGPVLPDFDEEVPQWLQNSEFFSRPIPETATNAHVTRSGNCLLKTSLLKNTPGPFDVNFGLTGGEDTFLFETLKRNGAIFINCKEAWVKEFVPVERTTIKFLREKNLKFGNNFARRMLAFSTGPKFMTRIYFFFKSILYAGISLVLSGIFILNKKNRTFWNLKTTANIGQLLASCGFNYRPYK